MCYSKTSKFIKEKEPSELIGNLGIVSPLLFY